MAVNKRVIYKWCFIISIALNVITVAYFIDRKVYFGYMRRHQFEKQKWDALFSTKSDSQEIIFIGSSLTEDFTLRSTFNNNHLKNMGFGGAETKDILNNFKRIILRKPPLIFVEAGINDVRNGKDMDTAFKNFVEMCILTKKASPATKLYVQSVLPTLNNSFNAKIKDYNTKVQNYCKLNQFIYIDMYNNFIVDGQLNAMATTDGIHLTPYGYYLWKKQLEPYLSNK
ncbi:GDSL-type esterase/lipase family protein [Mucilaginibacter sp. FT3.2]|uniref:GDSL-type esterase/lipase family protein n=1 Tax=Mucilaginibacter sp. FT3.2 TaxID=2723090 RepID=UPI00162191A0|nr:GDSL-type esterase/lipase family protein [Mucilaginibacter sp. FT3.2]MBB6234497.1 lysophospholipase L1-like esterase [Mucilaginibacter sp. FT3.2]